MRAADIHVKREDCSSLTFTFTLNVYLNANSLVPFGDLLFYFGDGETAHIPDQLSTPRPDLGPGISSVTYSLTHTYQQPGFYQAGYSEENRNAGVVNIPFSSNTPLCIYVDLYVGPLMGCNDFPELIIPPVDRTCPRVTFFHNPGAYDSDGDSLSYALTTPSYALGAFVGGYKDPDEPDFYTNYPTANEAGTGPPDFSIDPVTGLITWDAPELQGEYNIAFQIIEWRRNPATLQYEKLSATVRDMQIVVDDCENRRPDLIVPSDTCVEAGTVLSKRILGVDPESDPVKIEAFSELLEDTEFGASVVPDPAVLSPSAPPAVLDFDWTTDCLHVREQPYQVVFKITDESPLGTNLVTYKTWRIKVIAPAPEWRNADLNLIHRHAMLQWEPYRCENAVKIQLWRKVGTAGFEPSICSTGLPGFLGYELVGEFDPQQTSFTDTNGGKGLAVGAQYCYRLVAVFGMPGGGTSYASRELCLGPILIDAPLITEVSVSKTHFQQGEVKVGWWRPLEISATQFPGPYEYEVYRAEGFTAESVPVNISGRITDTTFVDVGINTEEKVYNYRIVLYSNTENDSNYYPLDTSAVASTVRLEGSPGEQRIILDWSAEVPWSNVAAENRRHLIYRGERGIPEDQLDLIDSIDVSIHGQHYVDNGKFESLPIDPNMQYCYRIITRGTYGNDKVGLLENSSQMVCLYPENELVPCPPLLSVRGLDCDLFTESETCGQSVFDNTVMWSGPPDGCREDIVGYNLYASSAVLGEFEPVAMLLRDTFYVEQGLYSLARCYRVAAVDALGRVSELSEPVCSDNCPYFELPNVFTPNGDACNDRFSTWYDPAPAGEEVSCPVANVTRCPRFVKEVQLKVFNRWGQEVYNFSSSTDGTIYIEWDGRTNDGTTLTAGVYYYIAQVQFDVLDPQRRTRQYNGWVQLIR